VEAKINGDALIIMAFDFLSFAEAGATGAFGC
jgi:hypothetical protein